LADADNKEDFVSEKPMKDKYGAKDK